MVVADLRLVIRTGLRRFFRRGTVGSECRSGARRWKNQIQIRAWMLHGGEGETAPNENAGELHFSWHYVPFGDRVASRFRFVGPKQEIDLRSLTQWGIVLCFWKSVSVLPFSVNRRNEEFGDVNPPFLINLPLLLPFRSFRLLKIHNLLQLFSVWLLIDNDWFDIVFSL